MKIFFPASWNQKTGKTSAAQQFTPSSSFPHKSSAMAMALLINIYPASAWRPPAVESLHPPQETLILAIRRVYSYLVWIFLAEV